METKLGKLEASMAQLQITLLLLKIKWINTEYNDSTAKNHPGPGWT